MLASLSAALATAILNGSVAPSPLARGPADPPERIRANDNRLPAGTFRNGVLTLRLELRTGRWHPEGDDGPGEEVQAFAEKGRPPQIPGPLIRVPQGTTIHAFVRNTLDSVLVLYGMHTRPGAPEDTVQIAPGATRQLSFAAGAPGTYYYWGSTTRTGIERRQWLDSQLSGAFIVDLPGRPADDRVFVLGMWFKPNAADSAGPAARQFEDLMVINGRMWPHTERLTYAVGDSVRWRWINATESSHPMHLHGFYYRIERQGDWATDTAYAGDRRPFVNTHLMLPGSTMAVAWQAQREGNWIFHCHFAFHVSQSLTMRPDTTHDQSHAPHQMSGLVIGLHVLSGARRPGATTSGLVRRLRLLMQEVPIRYDSLPGFGFVIQDPRLGAPRDTVPSDSVPVAGPTLFLTRGEPVAITVVNRLRQPTAVHWHGIELESFPDGVPGWSGTPGRIMPPIAPGDSFVAEFVPPRSGTFLYHSHSNESAQISSGLYGALIVLDPGQTLDPRTERVFVLGATGPFPNVGMLNGEREPPEVELTAGVTYRFRLLQIQPDWRVHFSLLDRNGLAEWRPIAKDGADLPPALRVIEPARVLAGPGETADFEFTPTAPGVLRLEVTTWGVGWHLPVAIRVRR